MTRPGPNGNPFLRRKSFPASGRNLQLPRSPAPSNPFVRPISWSVQAMVEEEPLMNLVGRASKVV